MRPHSFLSSLFLLLALSSCIDPYDPKLVGGERYLVFEGVLTNAPGPYYFSLSESAGYNSTESVFDRRVTGAELTVTDDAGRATRFIDVGKGRYISPAGLRGQSGRRYTLTVRYKGQNWQSEPELMQPVPDIESVSWVYQSKLTPGGPGVFPVYVSLTDPADTENYYQWDWKHYEQPDFCVLYTPPGSAISNKKLCCTDCWNITSSTGEIIMASDRLINGNKLAGQRIAEVPYSDVGPYYLAIGQQSLSRSAYQYWQTVQALTGNVGGVFDATPATLTGNIKNQQAAGSQMLGYFQVSARKERIVYVTRLTGGGQQPFAKDIYPLWPICEPCTESPYRTGVKPEGWQ